MPTQLNETCDTELKKLARLTAKEWSFLLRALILLAWTSVRLLVTGYQSTLKSCSSPNIGPSELPISQAIKVAKDISRLVNVAAHFGPHHTKCLCRSLVLLRLMSSEGLMGELVLGAKLEKAKFTAHAWVQLNGQVVNDCSEIGDTFGQFWRRGGSLQKTSCS
jgi:Transglutaminase-like superfamily